MFYHWIRVTLIFFACIIIINDVNGLEETLDETYVKENGILQKNKRDSFVNITTERNEVTDTKKIETLIEKKLQEKLTSTNGETSINNNDGSTNVGGGESFNMLHDGDFKNITKILPQVEDVKENINITKFEMKSDDTEWIEEERNDDDGEKTLTIKNDIKLINLQGPSDGMPFNYVIMFVLTILIVVLIVFFFVHRWKKSHFLRINHKMLVEEDDIKHFSI